MRIEYEYLKRQVRKKIDREYRVFRKRMLKEPKRRIFESATEISFKDHMVVVFHELIEDMDETELAVLLRMPSLLEWFYEAWCSCEEDSTETDLIACFWRSLTQAEKEMQL